MRDAIGKEHVAPKSATSDATTHTHTLIAVSFVTEDVNARRNARSKTDTAATTNTSSPSMTHSWSAARSDPREMRDLLETVLAMFLVAVYAGLSVPVIGLGLALQHLTPGVTLLIFGLVIMRPAIPRGARRFLIPRDESHHCPGG